jgi:ABC-type antimicrobial peptide transport system permease subunit
VYWPFSAEHWMAGAPWLVARVRGEAHDGLEVLREAAAEAAPGLPLMGSTSLREVIGKATSEQRFLGAALSGMTIIGLILAAVGVFGAAEYALRRRTRELAVRTALGAGRGAIVRTVTQRLAAVVLAAFGLGAVLSVVVVDWLGSLAFGIEPLDARLLASIAAALTALLVVSVVGPVRRALLIDPAVELGRAE